MRIFESLVVICAMPIVSALAQSNPEPLDPPVQAPAALPAPAGGALEVPAPIDPVVVDPAGAASQPTAAAAEAMPVAATVTVDPNARSLNEFQGDDVGQVLRLLARQAKVNMVVSDRINSAEPPMKVTMRLENKTPMEAIRVIITAKGLIMDEIDGVFFVKTQEEKAKEPTESANYTFSYATAEKVVPLLAAQLQSGVAPQIDARTNTVFYREAKSNLENIKLFLSTIDRPTQQVMIEARLVEVTSNPKQSYGINWAGTLGSSSNPQTFRYGGSGNTEEGELLNQVVVNPETGSLRPFDFVRNGELGPNFFDSLSGQFAILSVPQMSATLRLLNEDSDAEFLANPRVVTANNQKATIKITRTQPVPQLNFNEQTATAVFGGFEDKEYGNTLAVTPAINKDDFITLAVQPEISNKVGDATFTFAGARVSSPVIDKRSLDSNVLIKSGDTLAIGGLLQDESNKGRTKVPVLGDIPVLGYLFQERVNNRDKRNLLVFVTPTIIKQGYGTGLEDQVTGLNHAGDEYSDPNGWRNNAKGAVRLVPTSNRQNAADYPVPGTPLPPKKTSYKVSAPGREK